MLILFLLFVSADAATFTRRFHNPSGAFFQQNWDAEMGLYQAVARCITNFDYTGDCCLPSKNINSVQGMVKGSRGSCSDTHTHLSYWNVSAVTSMNMIFKGRAQFNQPLFWNVSSVTSATNMFLDADSFQQPLCGEWLNWSPDLKTATTKPQFFGDETTCVYTCPNGTPVEGTGTGGIQCASCNSGYALADNSCIAMYTCPNGTPLDGIANEAGEILCASCNSGYAMQTDYSCRAAKFTLRWSTDADVYGLIEAVAHCIEIDNTGDCCLPSTNIDDIQGMHNGSCSDTETHLSHWDVSEVTNMRWIFNSDTHFNQPLQWDVSSVTNMNEMFAFAKAFNQPIGHWDVSSVNSAIGMFSEADSFEQPLCGKWVDWSSGLQTATTKPDLFGDETTCVYTCPNGTPLDGIANEAGEIGCASCNSGYLIEDNSCRAHLCTCPHGTPGVGCVNDGDVACSECDCGFTLDDHTCIVNQTLLKDMLQYVQDDTLLVNRYKELKCEAQ